MLLFQSVILLSGDAGEANRGANSVAMEGLWKIWPHGVGPIVLVAIGGSAARKILFFLHDFSF